MESAGNSEASGSRRDNASTRPSLAQHGNFFLLLLKFPLNDEQEYWILKRGMAAEILPVENGFI